MPNATQKQPGWSKAQQVLVHRAAKAADWNTAQRYIAMKHVGCPLLGKQGDKDRRPSVGHPRNTNAHFELLMALAESHALTRGRGDLMPKRLAAKRDGNHFWSDSAVDRGQGLRQLAQRIAEEARLRMPTEFGADFLEGFIVRMTNADDASVSGVARPRHLLACDEGQCYRIVEGLKAWVGRKLAERGMTPYCFKWQPPKKQQDSHHRGTESAERNPEPGTRDPAASGGAA